MLHKILHFKVRAIILLLIFFTIISTIIVISNVDANQEKLYLTESLILRDRIERTTIDPLESVPYQKLSSVWKEEAQKAVQRLNSYNQYISVATINYCCVDPKLIKAMLIGESHAKDESVPRSDTGACGPLQVTPKAKKELVANEYFSENDDRCDVKTNIQMGVKYMWHLENVVGIKDVKLRIIAYNEGPTGSKKYVNNPDIHKYLQRIAYSYSLL